MKDSTGAVVPGAKVTLTNTQTGVTAERTSALPLNGREYSALTLLSPGARQSSIGASREASFNINGLRSTFNNFLIDGVDNNAYGTSNQGFSNQVMQPPPDAVGEIKVVTNNMSAEYGRSAGATVNVAYASGTNTFRGSAWEFARRTDFNATGAFRPANGIKPAFDRDQYGGVLGGPIVKNKAFFFADVEMLKQTRGANVFSTLPTAAQRQGILAVDVRNPLTGEVYPAGTAIPMSAFARKVLSDLPAPRCSRFAWAGPILKVARTRPHSARLVRSRPTASAACRLTPGSPAACRRSSSTAIPTWAVRPRTRSGSTRRC